MYRLMVSDGEPNTSWATTRADYSDAAVTVQLLENKYGVLILLNSESNSVRHGATSGRMYIL